MVRHASTLTNVSRSSLDGQDSSKTAYKKINEFSFTYELFTLETEKRGLIVPLGLMGIL